MNKDKVKNITLVALFIALVFIGSKIYIGTHDTFRFHLGNSMCLLSAFILSPLNGGLASGLGSLLFDILSPEYTAGALGVFTYPITFVSKFAMGYVAGIFFHKVFINFNTDVKTISSGVIGELAYIILYGIKTYIERKIILSMDIRAVIPILIAKLFTSVINAVIAVFISLILYKLISKVKKPQNKP